MADKTLKDRILAVVHHRERTMFVAIAMDKEPVSYSPIIGWRRHVWGPFGGSAIVQFNYAVNELIARLPLMVKYRGIHLGI